MEAGLVEAQGTGRGRTYMLSAKVYRKSGQKAAYIRQAGFEAIQQGQMVIAFIERHGAIKRADVVDLCNMGPFQATRLLKRLSREGKIEPRGKGKGAFYVRRS